MSRQIFLTIGDKTFDLTQVDVFNKYKMTDREGDTSKRVYVGLRRGAGYHFYGNDADLVTMEFERYRLALARDGENP